MEIKDINQALQMLEVVEPLLDFSDPGPIKPHHFEVLALMYAQENYRSYLTRLYNSSVKAAALRSNNEVDMAFGKAQALVYKKLLIDAKNAFEHADRLKKLKEKHAQEQSGQSNEGV